MRFFRNLSYTAALCLPVAVFAAAQPAVSAAAQPAVSDAAQPAVSDAAQPAVSAADLVTAGC